MGRTRLAERTAFTLVELLVVIAIIGVLVALLLPAVRSARASAERTTCANHLKQLALAFPLHEGAHGFLPSAVGPDWTYHMTYIDGAPAVAPDQHGGWGFQILPYMEAEAVWSGQGATTDIDRSIQAISTPHQIMFCPSRRAPEVVEAVDWYHHPNTGRSYGHAKNDYAACCHDEDVRASHVDPNVEGDRRLFLDAKGVGAILKLDGLQLGRITDGTSKTLLLAEKRMNVKLLGQMQANDNEGYTCGWNHDILRFKKSFVPVTGRITMNAAPLEVERADVGMGAVEIEFHPLEKQHPEPERGVANADGTFDIPGPTGQGIPPGKYRVAVLWMNPYPTDQLQGRFNRDNSPIVRVVDGQPIEIELADETLP